MTVEEYRQRMINAFHNADCDNLIALVALPTEKEFEHLEWLLKNHYHNQKQQPCEDCCNGNQIEKAKLCQKSYIAGMEHKQKTGWIPVSERLPEDLEPVNITWVNREPEPYYHDIKDKNFVATGIHYRGQWYWYSTTCADYLGEYGSNEIDLVDNAIEIVAWTPLPAPFEPQESEDKE